ncbi:uncharacterized protein LOC128861058 [Anastrepha ludens]|uniref:uncharacterized protein LOC128861058 n=1 Tax=Anastrepha ludens TaxID=28586 RepID=UPI0023B180D2|nr:uncharacterized protein LOC128861058 [Anastrepha ludens]
MEPTTIVDYLYETSTFAPQPTFVDGTTDITDTPFADELAALTPKNIVDRLLHSGEQLTHNQITFEIPSHHDLEHINTLHTFNTLLQRIGNVAYDTVASASAQRSPDEGHPFGVDATGQRITSEQISNSAVLNLADLKNGERGSVGGSFLEDFLGDADMHMIINYLWIGVVTALVVLSVIFIVFSCYFYRKFRQWKKCNKDIRNHLNNGMYADGHLVGCDRLMDAHGQHPATAAATAYYQQIESPPCYTIATGLPTYNEALHHHQHFSYGMKFMYPSITAVHHHPVIAGVYTTNGNNSNSNNNKSEIMLKQQSGEHWQQRQQQLMKQKSYKVSPLFTAAEADMELEREEVLELDVPTTYDIAELHGLNLPAAAMGVAEPLLGVSGAGSTASSPTLEEVITIRLDEMTPTATLAAKPTASRRPRILYYNEQRHSGGEEEQRCSAMTIT